MHDEHVRGWIHSHEFGQAKKQPGELRTIIVIAITGVMMIIEVIAGVLFGSMALLADGLHMASHAAALSISAFAYIYARRNATDERFSFGTGKVNALGGFTGAVMLVLFALIMAWESFYRFLTPVDIAFNQAILVAIVGLVINGVSVFVLGDNHRHEHSHADHEEQLDGDIEHGSQTEDLHHRGHHHHDHNLRAAYLHVLADALTSLLAIFALLAGKYFGLIWMDPLMGIIGAILVGRWSVGLLRSTSGILLDRQGPEHLRTAIVDRIKSLGDHWVTDLHLWSIGPNIYATALTVVSHDPKSPDHYKTLLSKMPELVHLTIEVHRCDCSPDDE